MKFHFPLSPPTTVTVLAMLPISIMKQNTGILKIICYVNISLLLPPTKKKFSPPSPPSPLLTRF